MKIINMMEEFVDQKLKEKLINYDCCKCKVCFGDMKAYALNTLPTHYVNTDKGILFTKAIALEQQNNVDIDVAIIKAIETVQANPRCGNKK